MTLKVQHKRSAVKGKAPLPADLEYGEIAVNYEATDPALYIKDSANAVRKIGNQPAATETVAGIVELATAAETTTGTDATRAVHPAGLKVELDKKATKTVTSDTAPANPADGDLWYDSVGGELYVWYDSDDAGAVAGTWVQANPQPTPKELWDRTGTTLTPKTAGDSVQIQDRLVLSRPIGATGGFTNNAGNLAELNLRFYVNNRMNVIGNGGCGIQVAGWYLISADVLARPTVGGTALRTDLVIRRFDSSTSTSMDLSRHGCNVGGETQVGGTRVVQLLANDYITFRCETAGTGDLFGTIGQWNIWHLHG